MDSVKQTYCEERIMEYVEFRYTVQWHLSLSKFLWLQLLLVLKSIKYHL